LRDSLEATGLSERRHWVWEEPNGFHVQYGFKSYNGMEISLLQLFEKERHGRSAEADERLKL